MIKVTSPIEKQLKAVKDELKGVQDYPMDKLISIIQEVGFECDFCARCCTREFNDHVFLLNDDAVRIKAISSDSLEPAPYYELCDQHGRFYVSGYSLKVKKDGSCIFLHEKKCAIYGQRPLICRLYPYMLHREADEDGNIDWRQIAGPGQHGCYHTGISDDESEEIALLIKSYETGYLMQVAEFFKKAEEHFKKNGLKHVQSVYDGEMRKFNKGEEITVFVLFNDDFIEHKVKKESSQ
ncbi:YkgJ family cysteine cluster protein [Methanolobus mangrovi]|uniref:YkgJ family cysteine cluster protein n=1 Tax=Methanolobus mangrovi TaxID=3072977 RepID=A0AA51UH95_9EURY|nr:YkgJ family cysteine cluster protein [Methanolobus mangrovi]WMW22117.1 YkgJ family cysteine cluster protein [Methanolobus mangrovi]